VARKFINIVLYVIAGIFVYAASLLAFVDMNSLASIPKPPAWAKFAIMGGVSIPGVVALLIGLAINRFRHWKRDVGIVLVSGAGTTAFVAFAMACILLSPELKELFPRNKLDFFNDFVTGVSCIIALTATGVALITISRKQEQNHTLQSTP
jgi:hypothetical protein